MNLEKKYFLGPVLDVHTGRQQPVPPLRTQCALACCGRRIEGQRTTYFASDLRFCSNACRQAHILHVLSEETR